MNFAQIHLMLNHLPVTLFLFCIPLALYALWSRKSDVVNLALVACLGGGVLTLPAYFTGEDAEEVVEHLSGVDEQLIESHEESAELSLVLGVLTALGAGLVLGLSRWKPAWTRRGLGLVVLLLVVTAGSMARTAHLGGAIRHTEIRTEG